LRALKAFDFAFKKSTGVDGRIGLAYEANCKFGAGVVKRDVCRITEKPWR
jgi:hypothetical protein